LEVIEPEMSGDERQSLSQSAEALKKAAAGLNWALGAVLPNCRKFEEQIDLIMSSGLKEIA
jgi:hypothetical protein